MSAPTFYSCVLCSTRPKTKNRRKLNGPNDKQLRKFLQQKFLIESANLFSPGSVICNKCRLRCSREMGIAKSNNTDPDRLLCAPRKDPDYAPPNTPFTQSALTVHSPFKWKSRTFQGLYQFVLGIICFWTNLPYFLLEQDAVQVICLTIIFIIMQSNRFLKLEQHSGLMELLTEICDIASRGNQRRIYFDSRDSLSDSDILNLTGLTRNNFDDLCGIIQKGTLRDSRTRSVCTCLGIFLTKLKSGMPNKILCTLFNLGRDSVRRAVSSARKCLSENFVPSYLGFQHFTREEIISSHTTKLAQSLFGQSMSPAILVADGTFIYIQKSSQFKFQRKCYSMHKHRPLVKPMVFVSTTGYIISVIGPYFSDGKNNDAQILNHIIRNDTEEFKQWMSEEDVLIVDRGFRDSLELLQELGIRAEMPSFVQKGESQLPVEESNITRMVTKIRWIVESVNGRLKL